MKQGGQKAKGSSFERVVGKLFSEAYYPDGSGEFKRVPLSGGWDKRVTPGDLMALKRSRSDSDEMVIDQSWPFSVECKNWKDIKHFFTGLYGVESQMFDWMGQAISDAVAGEKIPLVIFKLYRQEHVAMLLDCDFHRITALFGRFPKKLYAIRRFDNGDMPDFGRSVANDLMLCLLKDFIDWIDWEVYKQMKKALYLRSIIRKDG